MNKLLYLGSSGLLGKNILPYLKLKYNVIAPSHTEFDITKPFKEVDCDILVNSIAYTDVVGAETEREKCWDINVQGTLNLLNTFQNTPFVFISSEYAHNPVNYYSKTKLAGEIAVQALASKYLIIRTLFKPVPFPYPQAFADQWTMGDEINIIAPLIADAINNWDGESKTIYIGTNRKRIIDIARKSRPDVKECSIKDVKGVVLPSDYI